MITLTVTRVSGRERDRCPRCHRREHVDIYMAFIDWRAYQRCHRCGLYFDEEW